MAAQHDAGIGSESGRSYRRFGHLVAALIVVWVCAACSSPGPGADQPAQSPQSAQPIAEMRQGQAQAGSEELQETNRPAAPGQASVEQPVTTDDQPGDSAQIEVESEVSAASVSECRADHGVWPTAAIANLAQAYAGVQGVWAGFDPNDHPALAVLKDDSGGIVSVLALNFPSPDQLGSAIELCLEGTPFHSLHRIDDLEADLVPRLTRIRNFEFNAYVQGVDSLVVIARTGDFILDVAKRRWSILFIHEMFHRYQYAAFRGERQPQDFEAYPLTAENLALAALEDRALVEAVSATDGSVREEAGRRFAAIRITRLKADRRIALDNDQERSEGTARYLEQRLAEADVRFRTYMSDHTAALWPDPFWPPGGSVKSYYSFGRFYATGAAILRLLDLLEVEGVQAAVEAGQSPAEVLIEYLSVREIDVEQLVADAHEAYDPLNTLAAASQRNAEAAKQEPPLDFGAEIGDGVTEDVQVEVQVAN